VDHILLQNINDAVRAHCDDGCNVRIGVSGYRSSSYVLNAVSSESVSLLQLGVPRTAIISSGQTLRLAVPYSPHPGRHRRAMTVNPHSAAVGRLPVAPRRAQDDAEGVCADVPGFADALDFACGSWVGFSCTDEVAALWGYDSAELQDVVNNCAYSCGLCSGTPSITTTTLRVSSTTTAGSAMLRGFCSINDVAMQDVCVPFETDTDTHLEENTNILCTSGGLDCSPIEAGGAHFQPNTPFDHASWAYNAFYQLKKGTIAAATVCIGRIEIADDGVPVFEAEIGTTQSSSVLRITPEMFETTCGSSATIDQVYVGLFGFQLSTVQVLAEMELVGAETIAGSASLILSGQPQSSSVAFQRGRLYKFITGSSRDDIDIKVTVSTGNVDVFVSTSQFRGRESIPRINLETGAVDPNSYVWSSTSSVSQEEVSIVHTDALFCYECVYYVLVYGVVDNTGQDSQFSIVVSSDSAPVTLTNGVPHIDNVRPEGYSYFQIAVVDPTAELSVAVVPLWGDPDVFIDSEPNTRPTQANTNDGWKLMRIGGDSVTIQTQDLLAHCDNSAGGDHEGRPCHYYIGVNAYGQNCSFVITASLNSGWSNPQQLIPGVPQLGRVNTSTYEYYQMSVLDGFDLSIVLNPLEDGDPDLYVSFSRDVEPGPLHISYVVYDPFPPHSIRYNPPFHIPSVIIPSYPIRYNPSLHFVFHPL
jgi:hypothetical protein